MLHDSRKKKKKKLSMFKFWVPRFQPECASSVYTGPRKRRNQFAHSHEVCLWKMDSVGREEMGCVCPSWS